jgi:hypothetical protein
MDSWWELGESSGFRGDKPELWRIECAFCGEKGNFGLAYHAEKKKPNSNKKLNFDLYQCRNCMGFVQVFWSAGEGFGAGLYGMRTLPWPLDAKREPSENWPEGVKRFWIQAHDSLKRENWDAANVMARSAVQFVVREKNAKKGVLKDQIDDLVSKGVLHPLMKDWADEVRIVANESAHPEAPIPEDATPQDSRDIVNFLDLLLTYLYDLLKQIENFRRRKAPAVATGP